MKQPGDDVASIRYPYVGRNAVDELIRRSAMGIIKIEDFPLIMDLQAEARARGHAEGRAEGLAQGRAEGRAEAHVEMVANRVRLKYGDEAVVGRAMPPLYIDDLPAVKELQRAAHGKGREQGRAEGRIEGRAGLLAHLVGLKYGGEGWDEFLAFLDPAAITEGAGVLLDADRDAFGAWLAAHQI